METGAEMELFAAAPPGLEPVLLAEIAERGFSGAEALPGGVRFRGGWPEAWRANLELRGAGRILARIGGFRALHLAQLDKRARRFPWAETLLPGEPVKVEATCKGSRIYHAGAAAQRVARALQEAAGVPVVPATADAAVRLMVRIEDDLCTFSVDTSGAPLHRRGHKEAVGKAPLRETLAALFLRDCGYAGAEPVADPMCGSGTFVLEAAEIALGLAPGRSRAFAFERLAGFDPVAWERMRAARLPGPCALRFFGTDRDAGAIAASRANAERAGVAAVAAFEARPVSAFAPPEGPPGLVMINPPYGGRVGERKRLAALYGALGQVVAERCSGWRVGLVTTEPALARATGLPFGEPGPPVPHGGLKIRLWRTGPLR